MAYGDIAPTLVSLGITESQTHTFFDNQIQLPEPPVEPPHTRPKAVAIAQALYITGIQAAGGLIALATLVRLRVYQVKVIIGELRAAEAEWRELQ